MQGLTTTALHKCALLCTEVTAMACAPSLEYVHYAVLAATTHSQPSYKDRYRTYLWCL